MKKAILGKGYIGSLLFDFYNQDPAIFHTQSSSYNIKNDPVPTQVSEANTIFFMIPPPREDIDSYFLGFEKLLYSIKPSQHFIFISSTSVFSSQQRNCDEETSPQPDSKRSKIARKLEVLVQSLLENVTIIRSAGQIGPDRYPVKSLIRKNETILGGLNKVNIIHVDDLVRIIHLTSIKDFTSKAILHAVSPYHPTRQEFYTEQAKLLGLKAPIWRKELSNHKIIRSSLLDHFDFKYSNPNKAI